VSSRDSSVRCTATKADGSACRAWAIRGSDPPRCAAHSGRVGAPPGNQNARTHGGYSQPAQPVESLEDAIKGLEVQLSSVLEYVGQCGDGEAMIRAAGLYGQLVSRYGRLLRDQRALSGESADSLLDVIGKALDEISTELGIKL
jgi:hypothetical protein